MSINIKKALFGDGRHKRSSGAAGGDAAQDRRANAAGGGEPAPVHRRPRTLLPGTVRRDANGVTLLARCQDGPRGKRPAALCPLPPGPHPPGAGGRGPHLYPHRRTGLGPDPPGSGGPEYVPLRTFRDDDLLDAGSDPSAWRSSARCLPSCEEGERVLCRLLLRSLGPDWSQAHQARKPSTTPATSENRDPSYTYQTRPLQLDGVTMAVLGAGALAALRGYLWIQDGEYLKASLLAAGSILSALISGGLGLVALEADAQEQSPRPVADHGRRWPASPSRASCNSSPSCPTAWGSSGPSEVLESGWPPPTATTTTPPGRGSRSAA